MNAVQNAEIVETPKRELPTERNLYVAKYYDSINKSWDATRGHDEEQGAFNAAVEDDAVYSSIRVYRLGPPKPRMTEAEVLEAVAAYNVTRGSSAMFEIDVVRIFRRLGVLPENET